MSKQKPSTPQSKSRSQATPVTQTPVSKPQPAAQSPARPVKEKAAPAVMPFTRMNYILLLAGVGIIALGFILMSLDPFIDATQFSISLHVAPVVVVAGFIEVIFAIMYRPRTTAAAAQTEA
ncbi:MAG: DUF3098 domain-containing protein [Bacteroidetes bacterium]|nr:MAG: DUF3098 domain-containing protein [Bacteroidota bacterium]